jgi:thiamine pyrophosphokinase
MRAWVLVAGRLSASPALALLPRPALVVAADGGARHAARLGVTVDLWVGDFDSSSGVELSAPRRHHPRDKAQTDAELAVTAALEAGATELTILGAFGGRFDHTLALALLSVQLAATLPVTLHSGDETGHPLLPGLPLTLRLAAGQTFSVLALDDLRGLGIRGARWPLEDADIPSGSGRTVSNEAAGGPLTLSVHAGRALVVVSGLDLPPV